MNEYIIWAPEIMLAVMSLTVFVVSGFLLFMLRPKRRKRNTVSQQWEYQYPQLYMQHAAVNPIDNRSASQHRKAPLNYQLPPIATGWANPPLVDQLSPAGYEAHELIDEPTRPIRVYSEPSTTNRVEKPAHAEGAIAYLLYQSGGQHLPPQLTINRGHAQRIGRSQRMCEVHLDDIRVSRNHALIRLINHDFYIQDEGSSGGTSINRRKLKITEQCKLSDGDLVGFNEVYYKFHLPKAS